MPKKKNSVTYPLTRGGAVQGFRERRTSSRGKQAKTPSPHRVVKVIKTKSRIVGEPKIEWDEGWLDIDVEFPDGSGSVKAQRGYDPRDFSFDWEPGQPEYTTLFIEEIGVSPEGKGYGTELYQLLETEARKHGIDEFVGEVVEDAVPFFLKMGWISSTEPETWEDTNWGRALRMCKRAAIRGRDYGYFNDLLSDVSVIDNTVPESMSIRISK